MSGELVSSDRNATITQKWEVVDLFCPHPFLRERPASRERSVVREVDSESHYGLLSTTAFRHSNTPTQEAPQQLHGIVVSFLELWREIRPQDIPRYAVLLRPIVSQIYRMYLRGQLVLSAEELAQMRELGQAVIQHCPMRNHSRVATRGNSETRAMDRLSDRLRGQHIGIGTRVAINGMNPRGSLTRETTNSTNEGGGHVANEGIRGWLRGV
ncbi:hypothetical protein RSOLAG1IB_06795 [Rhizoctonia solani AG-1 IB]|uniref:Uncharacterized protein n=1 Tax=Thanatephorus cucumeris (strain AG1-IB / isolate 7/3/14) TaxID=1108050 RepID=A0A0B7F997_THACB|nr:hypothetical protein RSOLAG1IB_06795 [Rhizoctonia solani AG-1 IB]